MSLCFYSAVFCIVVYFLHDKGWKNILSVIFVEEEEGGGRLEMNSIKSPLIQMCLYLVRYNYQFHKLAALAIEYL